MKYFLITISLLLISQCAFSNAITDTKRVVVEHWPPWEIAHDKKKQVVSDGIAVNLVAELMARLDEPMVLVTVPWKRALLEIEKGRSDLIPMVAKNNEREKYMLYTIPVFTDPILLAYSIKKLGSFQWKEWSDLKPYTFQLVRGYDYGSDWDKALKKYNYKYSSSTSDEQSLRMLMAGRIDLVPLFYINGTQLMQDFRYTNQLAFATKPIKETVLYFGISKKSPLAQRLNDVNNAMRAMKRDGSFARILGDLQRN